MWYVLGYDNIDDWRQAGSPIKIEGEYTKWENANKGRHLLQLVRPPRTAFNIHVFNRLPTNGFFLATADGDIFHNYTKLGGDWLFSINFRLNRICVSPSLKDSFPMIPDYTTITSGDGLPFREEALAASLPG
jgi:hypothetical protein